MDAAEQLQKIYVAGFELQTFDLFPRAIGVVRDNCIALLEATPEGLRMIGTPGWRLGEAIGSWWKRTGSRCSKRRTRSRKRRRSGWRR